MARRCYKGNVIVNIVPLGTVPPVAVGQPDPIAGGPDADVSDAFPIPQPIPSKARAIGKKAATFPIPDINGAALFKGSFSVPAKDAPAAASAHEVLSPILSEIIRQLLFLANAPACRKTSENLFILEI
jgi:hypothetical protein